MPILSRMRQLLSRRDESAASEALGAGHPLVDLLALRRSHARQLAVSLAAAAAGVVGVAFDAPLAGALLATSLLVALGVGLAFALAHHKLADLVIELVARGDAGTVPAVARARERLASRAERERLAWSLDHALRDAWRWHRLHPVSRPAPGILYLRHATRDARAVSSLLRTERVSVEGIAHAHRFLFSPDSPLYAQDADALKAELRHVRRRLELSTAAHEHHDRLAA